MLQRGGGRGGRGRGGGGSGGRGGGRGGGGGGSGRSLFDAAAGALAAMAEPSLPADHRSVFAGAVMVGAAIADHRSNSGNPPAAVCPPTGGYRLPASHNQIGYTVHIPAPAQAPAWAAPSGGSWQAYTTPVPGAAPARMAQPQASPGYMYQPMTRRIRVPGQPLGITLKTTRDGNAICETVSGAAAQAGVAAGWVVLEVAGVRVEGRGEGAVKAAIKDLPAASPVDLVLREPAPNWQATLGGGRQPQPTTPRLPEPEPGPEPEPEPEQAPDTADLARQSSRFGVLKGFLAEQVGLPTTDADRYATELVKQGHDCIQAIAHLSRIELVEVGFKEGHARQVEIFQKSASGLRVGHLPPAGGADTAGGSVSARSAAAAVPPARWGWSAAISSSTGEMYWLDSVSGQNQYETPTLPAGWEPSVSRSTGEIYYTNSLSGESTYGKPDVAAARSSVSVLRVVCFLSSSAAESDDTIAQSILEELSALQTVMRQHDGHATSAVRADAIQHVKEWSAVWSQLKEISQPGALIVFSGHGKGHSLQLGRLPVQADALAASIAEAEPACVVLNACSTLELGKLVQQHSPSTLVICWDHEVLTSTGEQLARSFLEAACEAQRQGTPDPCIKGLEDAKRFLVGQGLKTPVQAVATTIRAATVDVADAVVMRQLAADFLDEAFDGSIVHAEDLLARCVAEWGAQFPEGSPLPERIHKCAEQLGATA